MKAALYCRLSEEDRAKASPLDESGSIRNQRDMLTQYARERGWEIYRVYSDDDYAGADRNRPAFNQLLQDAQAHRFDVVLCKTQSRFTREMELVEKYLHGLFPAWGIRFIGVVDNADTENRGNKKARQINGLVNEWYLEDMSENIRSVLTSRRQNGFHIGAFAPYGYRKDPARKGHLLVDEEAAAVVREIFRLYAQGMGKAGIARRLNERGIPNATAYRLRREGAGAPPRAGSLWKPFSVGYVLTNEVYIGNLVQGKYGSASYKTKINKPRPKAQWIRVEGTHEPVVERALWDRVQARLAQRTKPFTSGRVGLFAGMAVCAGCGHVLRSHKSGEVRYLHCPTRQVSRSSCAGACISLARLERIVLAELNRLAAQWLSPEAVARGLSPERALEEEGARLLREEAALERRLAACVQGMRALYADRLRGLLAEADFALLQSDFAQERERLEAQGEALRAERARVEAEREGFDRAAFLRECLRLPKLTREAVEILVDHIEVGCREAGTRSVPITLYWNF
ncbi:MAG: recombinase family protein [Candidatus Spyradocola sp.]|jgi:site-specific DNA recombinase